MTCNCDNDGSNEYIIELGEFGLPGAKGDRGEQGYSPVVSYTTNSDTIQFTLVNENSTLTTPNYYDYLAKKDLSNSPIYTILSDYPTNSQVASTYLTIANASDTYFTKADALNKLNTNGSNAGSSFTVNNCTITAVGNATRIGATNGRTTIVSDDARPVYQQNGGSAKYIALLADIPVTSNLLITDGSNATPNITINGITLKNQSNYNNIIKAKDGLNLELSNGGSILDNTRASISLLMNGNAQISGDNNVNLSAVNDIHLNTTNGKAYYGATTDASKEIATVGDIGNGTVTITQGGVTKGTFTLNQSGDATIALDAGGSASTNPIVLKTTDESRSLTLGLNNDTKKAYMTYTISNEGMELPLPIKLIAGKSAPITLTETNEGMTVVGLDYNTNTLGLDTNNKLTVVGAETNFDVTKEDNGTTYTYTNGFDANNKYYEQIVQDDGNTTTTTNIISKYNFNGSNGIDVSVSSSTTDGNFANIRTYLISNNIDNSTIKVNGSGQLYADLEGKQNKLTSQNAGYGINIYDYYPDVVIPDYHAINSSQQYVAYSVADPTAWVSTRLQNPRGIAITDALDNIATGAFEYVALVPYSAGAGIGLKLNWDYDVSVLSGTDSICLSSNGGEEPTSSQFIISSGRYGVYMTVNITTEEYLEIQQQRGIWFKITSDGNGNYTSYYSFDNDTWVEIIFSNNSKFSPEHTPERPCIGNSYLYQPTATYNLQTAIFSFTPARDPYTKIEVDSTAYYTKAQVDALLQTLTARITALETNINGGNA